MEIGSLINLLFVLNTMEFKMYFIVEDRHANQRMNAVIVHALCYTSYLRTLVMALAHKATAFSLTTTSTFAIIYATIYKWISQRAI